MDLFAFPDTWSLCRLIPDNYARYTAITRQTDADNVIALFASVAGTLSWIRNGSDLGQCTVSVCICIHRKYK